MIPNHGFQVVKIIRPRTSCANLFSLKYVWSGHGRVISCPYFTLSASFAASSIGYFFRSPLWRFPQMRSSKMAAGSGRAAILRHRHNRDRKKYPKSWLMSFPAPPSWIQDGDGGNDVWRTSRRPWRRPTDVCPIHESCRSLTLLSFKKHLIVSLTQALSKWLSELPACYYAEVISLHMSKVVKNLRLQQAPTLLFLFYFYFF